MKLYTMIKEIHRTDGKLQHVAKQKIGTLLRKF